MHEQLLLSCVFHESINKFRLILLLAWRRAFCPTKVNITEGKTTVTHERIVLLANKRNFEDIEGKELSSWDLIFQMYRLLKYIQESSSESTFCSTLNCNAKLIWRQLTKRWISLYSMISSNMELILIQKDGLRKSSQHLTCRTERSFTTAPTENSMWFCNNCRQNLFRFWYGCSTEYIKLQSLEESAVNVNK